MIEVRFEEDGGKLLLQMQGHANYVPEGADVVCAAASMLAYTAAQTMSYLGSLDKLEEAPEICLEKGNVRICVCPKEEAYWEAQYAFFVCQVGFDLLAKAYPRYVQMEQMLG